MLLVTMTLTFDLLTPKSVGIIFGSWLSIILNKRAPRALGRSPEEKVKG